jgi:hypothetical protein
MSRFWFRELLRCGTLTRHLARITAAESLVLENWFQ